MLYEMFSLLGSPTQNTWPWAWDLAYEIGFKFPKLTERSLKNVFNEENDLATDEIIDLLYKMLMPNPDFRYSAEKCMSHPFFDDMNEMDKMNKNKDSYFDTNGDKKNID